MADSAVELRALSALKSKFINIEQGKVLELPSEVIVKEMRGIFEKYAKKETLIEKCSEFLKNEN